LTSCCIPQLSFSFYRHRAIRADFSGGQITTDAGLLPLRAFDQRHGLTRSLAECLRDSREEERVHHSVLSLLRQRLYQIIAGYEDGNDADRLRHDPAFQILADQPLGEPLGSQPTLSRWENAPTARELISLQDTLLDWFVKVCGKQVRKRGEILLDVDSTDDPTHGQQQLSFFNGGYDQYMYHPLLIFERHTGCLLAARLRRGTAASHARIIPLLLRIVPRLQRAFPNVRIKLRADAGFALPLLYEFCEFFGISYVIGISANSRLQCQAQRLQRRLARRYRRTHVPQRSFSSFSHRAYSWLHQRRICYKAEHTQTGTNLRFLVTNLKGRSRSVFAFYNDRGECENRIEEFKNGFAADRLSCHRFRANAFRLLLHSFAYNLVNLFRLQLPASMRSAQIETLRTQLFKIGARIRQTARCVRIHFASGWPFRDLFQTVAIACNSS
jgi:Transposase DDE domain group 1